MKLSRHPELGVGDNPDLISPGQRTAINRFKVALRKRATRAEISFRDQIAQPLRKRTNGCVGHAFQREFFIATSITFIVDFHFKKFRLAVEIDGSQHYTDEHQEYDKMRDHYLQSLGLHVLRFNNLEVLCGCEAVVQIIERKIQGKSSCVPHGEFIELW